MAAADEFVGAWTLMTLGETAKQILRDESHQVVVRKLANGDLHFELWRGDVRARAGTKTSFDPVTQRLTATLIEGRREYHFEAALATRTDVFAKPVLYGLLYPVSGDPGGHVGDEGAAGAWASQHQGPPPFGDDD
jgi:hypothetical protein